MKVKGTAVTAYFGTGDTRTIEGTCTVNNQSGFVYEVTVSDNGEPGTADVFQITVGSYTAAGTLAGGNIQLHKPCQ